MQQYCNSALYLICFFKQCSGQIFQLQLDALLVLLNGSPLLPLRSQVSHELHGIVLYKLSVDQKSVSHHGVMLAGLSLQLPHTFLRGVKLMPRL